MGERCLTDSKEKFVLRSKFRAAEVISGPPLLLFSHSLITTSRRM